MQQSFLCLYVMLNLDAHAYFAQWSLQGEIINKKIEET